MTITKKMAAVCRREAPVEQAATGLDAGESVGKWEGVSFTDTFAGCARAIDHHTGPAAGECPRLCRHPIALPLHNALTEPEVDAVATTLKSLLRFLSSAWFGGPS